eukprot:TRINITY_DN4276_c0_g10_i1.p3 TRINITY_DN4276_c0_g10~~TRINITY_DN4276_c0_g10_i1.p3  ORF type:complete len:126 (+),score=25.82 TRINITY_DN4276_c0_g10_i1:460-837(+)
MRFDHSFDCQPDEATYFALTYPFSYTDCQNLLAEYQQKYEKNQRIYFYRERLVDSVEGRRVDLVTITGRETGAETEDGIADLFPDGKARPLRFNKPVVFVTARVHPGETQGSHMMNGLLSFLLKE